MVVDILGICSIVGDIVNGLVMLVDVVNSVGNSFQVHEGDKILSVHLGDDTTVGCVHDMEVLWLEMVSFHESFFKINLLYNSDILRF